MAGKKIAYVRVSSEGQNPDRQLEGLEVDKIFLDKVSAKTVHRPQLEAMLTYVREEDVVIVHSMDRLARNLNDLLNLVKVITEKKATLVFRKESLTFSHEKNPLSSLMLGILGSIGEFERSLIKERQREGIELAKKRGVYQGRKKVFTSQHLNEIQELIKAEVPISKIAKRFRVSRGTIYNYGVHKVT